MGGAEEQDEAGKIETAEAFQRGNADENEEASDGGDVVRVELRIEVAADAEEQQCV